MQDVPVRGLRRDVLVERVPADALNVMRVLSQREDALAYHQWTSRAREILTSRRLPYCCSIVCRSGDEEFAIRRPSEIVDVFSGHSDISGRILGTICQLTATFSAVSSAPCPGDRLLMTRQRLPEAGQMAPKGLRFRLHVSSGCVKRGPQLTIARRRERLAIRAKPDDVDRRGMFRECREVLGAGRMRCDLLAGGCRVGGRRWWGDIRMDHP